MNFSFILFTFSFMLGLLSYADSSLCGSKNLTSSQLEKISNFFKKYENNLNSYENWSDPLITTDSKVSEIKTNLCKIISSLITGPCDTSSISLGYADALTGRALTVKLKNPNRGFLVVAPDVGFVMTVAPQEIKKEDLNRCQDDVDTKTKSCDLKWAVGSFVDPNDKNFHVLVAGVADYGTYSGCIIDNNGTQSSQTNYIVHRGGSPPSIDFFETNNRFSLVLSRLGKPMKVNRGMNKSSYFPAGYHETEGISNTKKVKEAI